MGRTTTLTPEEMELLDDGQGWWQTGDVCQLHLNASDEEIAENTKANFATGVMLSVNGEPVMDNHWCTLNELPESIKARLVTA